MSLRPDFLHSRNQPLLGWIFLQANELTNSSFRDKQKNSAIKRGWSRSQGPVLGQKFQLGTQGNQLLSKRHTRVSLASPLGPGRLSRLRPRKLVGGASSRHQPCQPPHEVRGCGALGRHPHLLLCPFLLPHPIGAQGTRGPRSPLPLGLQNAGCRDPPRPGRGSHSPAMPGTRGRPRHTWRRQRSARGQQHGHGRRQAPLQRAGGSDSRSQLTARPEAGRRKPRPSRPAHQRAQPGPGREEVQGPVPAARWLSGAGTWTSRTRRGGRAAGRGPAAPRFPGSGSLTRCLNQRSHWWSWPLNLQKLLIYRAGTML